MIQGNSPCDSTGTTIFSPRKNTYTGRQTMKRAHLQDMSTIALIVVLCLTGVPHAAAETPATSTIAYTITISEDGTALWQVEYRTPLATDADTAAFESYARTIESTALPEFRDLMTRSASQAAIANSRSMEVSGFKGTADIQTSPTGRYGVVLYSFTWTNFARPGREIAIGDAFAGGLYLPRDAVLTIRYPAGYTVKTADPAPDRTTDGLTWYGVRSFGAGRPQVVLEKEGLPLVLLIPALAAIVLAAGGFLLYRRRTSAKAPVRGPAPVNLPDTGADEAGSDESEPAGAVPLTAAEIHGLEDQITRAIRSAGGEMYQSDIVRSLGLPKSTVSSALNDMHARGIIVKIRKGRENLIRFAG